MSLLRSSIYLAGLSVALGAADASAEPSASARVGLHIRAEPYCGIAWAEKPIELTRRGAALIGRVTDTCNTRGYVVTAQFERLRGGVLIVDGERFPIGQDGSVTLVARIPQLHTALWRLENAVLEAGYTWSPMHLTIAPL